MLRPISGLAAAALLASCAVPGPVAPPVPGTAPDTRRVLQAEADGPVLSPAAYLKFVHMNNMAEIGLSEVALQRAAKGGVRAYANRLIADHRAADEKVKALATAECVILPDTLPPEAEAALAALCTLNGLPFDRRFIAFNIAGHRKAIAVTEAQAEQGTDPEVRAFAAKALPTLRAHLATALGLEKALSAP